MVWRDRHRRRPSSRSDSRSWRWSHCRATACDAVGPLPSFDIGQCVVGYLDGDPDPAALFADPLSTCVIIAWDTEMDGAGVGLDGGLGTPLALTAAATNGGFTSPCETNVSPAPALRRAFLVHQPIR